MVLEAGKPKIKISASGVGLLTAFSCDQGQNYQETYFEFSHDRKAEESEPIPESPFFF
jgi:hypothetical protein